MMNEEILQEVLSELSETDKDLVINNRLLTKAVECFAERLTEMENKISNLKVTVPAPDMQPIVDMLQKHFKKAESIIAAQPKQVLQEKHIILFPLESHKLDFYKKIFSQFLKWAVIVIIVLMGFKYLNDAYYDYASNARYKRAWETLYQSQNKKGRKLMDSMFTEINSTQ